MTPDEHNQRVQDLAEKIIMHMDHDQLATQAITLVARRLIQQAGFVPVPSALSHF
jgi:hypothetical protein